MPTSPLPPVRSAAATFAALLFLVFAVPLIVSLFFKADWLWMDEVLSQLLISDPSWRHMNAAIVSGMDANPPLFPNVYWALGHLFTANPYFLRGCSILLFAGTIALFYRYLCRLLGTPGSNFLLVLLLATTTYLNFSLATQIRSYALFFALGLAYFISVHRLLLAPRDRGNLLAHVGVGVLLVAVHNFGLFYLTASAALFVVLILATRGRFSLLPLAAHGVVLAIWLATWFPSFVLQAMAGDPHSWIVPPTWRTFFFTVGEIAPSLSSLLERTPAFFFLPVLRFVGIVALFAYLLRLKLKAGWNAAARDPAFLFFLLSGWIYLATVVIALVVTRFHTSVFLSRYLWPSHLLILFQLIYAFHHFAPRAKEPSRWFVWLSASAAAGFIFVQNRKIVQFPQQIVPIVQALPGGYPVFVETADYFLPFWQHTRIPVHYVFDWTSAIHPGNALSATVENSILDSVQSYYAAPGLERLSQFNANRFPHFYVVDEAAIYQFERFLSQGRIKILREIPTAVPGHRIVECTFTAR